MHTDDVTTDLCTGCLQLALTEYPANTLQTFNQALHCSQAVGLRGYAQRDPLVEYKLEGYNLFLEMMASIRRNTIYNVYMFQPAKVLPACLLS